MTDNSIINVGDMSKPADTLINKIADAIGGLAKPYQIRRLAQAQSEADLIKSDTEIEIEGRKRRALARFVAEETKKQENIEQITEKAIPLLAESANPQNMDNDWITNFFDKCRIVSDQDMQKLWSKILAGESNSPGSYSKRTINLLGSLDKDDAEFFSALCNFTLVIGENKTHTILIFDEHNLKYSGIYSSIRLSFENLTYLDDLGLINYNPFTGFSFADQKQIITVEYYGRCKLIQLPKPPGNELPIGQVTLSRTGTELARICEPKYIEGFYDSVIQYWGKQGIRVLL